MSLIMDAANANFQLPELGGSIPKKYSAIVNDICGTSHQVSCNATEKKTTGNMRFSLIFNIEYSWIKRKFVN